MSEGGGNDQGSDIQGNDGYNDTSTDTEGFSDTDADNDSADTSIQGGDQESDDLFDNTQASSDTSATSMMDSSSDLSSTAPNEISNSDQEESEYEPSDWDPTPGPENDFDWDWDPTPGPENDFDWDWDPTPGPENDFDWDWDPTPGPEDDFDWDWDPTPGPEDDFDWDWDPTPGPEDDFDWDWDPTAESDKKEISHNTEYDNEKEICRTHSKTLEDYRQERDEGKSIDKEDKKSELNIDEFPIKETEKKDTDKVDESKGVEGIRKKINFNREKQTETTLLSIEQEEKKQDDDADEIEEIFPKELPEDSLNREEEIYLPIKAPSEEEIKYVDLEDTVEKIHEKEEKEKKGVREEINDANMLEPLQDAPSEVEVKLIDTIERAQTRDQESHEHYDMGEEHRIKEDSAEMEGIREDEDSDVHLRERKPHEKLYEDEHLEDVNEHRHDLVDKGHDDQYHQEIIEEVEVIPVEEESYDEPFDEFSDEEASENTRNIYEQEEYRRIEEDLQEQKEREEERIEQEMVQERIDEEKEKHNNIVQKVVDYNQINNEREQQEIRERKRREQREKDVESIRKGKELMERRRKDQELKEPVRENINAEREGDHGFIEEETNEDSHDTEKNIENQKRSHRKEMRPKKEEDSKGDLQNQTEKKKEEIIRKDLEIDQNRLKKLEEEYRKTGHRPYYGGERTKGFDEYIKKVIDQEPKNNKAHCIKNEIQKEHRETINEKRGSIKEEEWEKVLVKWIEEIDQEELSKSERLRLIGILRIYRRLQELAKRKEYLKRKDSHMPLSKGELREFYEITAELEKVPEIFRRLWKRFWNFMNFYNKNSIWHKYLIKQNKQTFLKEIVSYYEQVILGRKVDISAQIKKLRSLNEKHKNIVLSILNKSTRSEEEIEELTKLLSELGTDDLIKIFGEEYRDHTKYYVRLGLDYNQNIRRKMILDYIKELVNSNITSNLLSNEKDINIAEQGASESEFFDQLRSNRGKHQVELRKVLKAINDMKGKDPAERKTILENIFGFNDGDTDRTDLMKKFLANPNNKLFSVDYKPSPTYRDWLQKRIDVLEERINIGNNNRKFTSRSKIMQNLGRYGDFAKMVEGDKYEILLPVKQSSLIDFLVDNNMEKFAEEFAIFLNGGQVNDFSITVDSNDEIMVIPKAGSEGQLSPQFIKGVINPILKKIEDPNNRLAIAQNQASFNDFVSESERKLVKLWWSTAEGPLYDLSTLKSGQLSPYAGHLSLLRDELMRIMYFYGVIKTQDYSNMDIDIRYTIADIYKLKQLRPSNPLLERWFTSLEYDLMEIGQIEGVLELSSLFDSIFSSFGYEINGLYEKVARLLVKRWATIMFKTKDNNGIRIIDNNTPKDLGIFYNDNRMTFHDFTDFSIDSEGYGRSKHKPATIDNYIDGLIDAIKREINNNNLQFSQDEILDIRAKLERASVSYKELITIDLFELIDGFEMDNGKRILLEQLGVYISAFFGPLERAADLEVSIASTLQMKYIFSKLLFQDKNYLVQVFLSNAKMPYRPAYIGIYWIIENLNSYSYEEFLDLTRQNLNRDIIIRDVFNEFINGMIGEIDRWAYNNHYPALYMAPKKELHYKLYGDNFEVKEFQILYQVWRSFYHIFERKITFNQIEMECNIKSSLTSILTNKDGLVFNIEDLLKVAETLEEYENLLANDTAKLEIIRETLKSLDEYIIFRRKNQKNKRRENPFLEGRLSYNPEFRFDESRMPKDLIKMKNYLKKMSFLEGGADLRLRDLILKADKEFKNSISKFSKSPYTTKFDKKKYSDFFSEFSREIIDNKEDLRILNALNKLAQRRDMRESVKTENDGQANHIWFQKNAFELLDDMVVVSDMFVFYLEPSIEEMVYGHIDLLVIIGKNIYVCDYKPKLNFEIRSELISNHFCDSIPQISVYAIVLEKMFPEIKQNGYNVFCYTFRDRKGYIYNPESALEAYSAFFISQKVDNPEDMPPWMFLLTEPSREDWEYWYRKYLE